MIKIWNGIAFKLVEGIGGVINSIRLVRFVGRQFGNGKVKFIIYNTTFFSYFLLIFYSERTERCNVIVRSCIGHLVQLQFRFDDATLVSYLSCNFFQNFDVGNFVGNCLLGYGVKFWNMRYIDRKIYPILATNSNFAVNMRKYENWTRFLNPS